jgi:tetratricopeptide (TPR) repeat protein
MQTNELRLFVSSTFRDLMGEREVLVKKIFPKLRELCRERGVHFTEIDLRWGITAEEARTGKVVRICLEEIEKCSPYFLGILGSRHGWQPGAEVLANDPALAEDFPSLPAMIADGRSITEIEFLHGAILPKNTASAFIYSRQNTSAEADESKLMLVRERVSEAGVPLRSFLTPDELGELVLRDLTAVIERDFALTHEPDALALMRGPHEAFSVNRRRSYVADPGYVKLFGQFVQGEGSPLVLTARSGLGKSSLVAYLAANYKEQNENAFVVTHFVGASSAASGANDIIRHVMTEIKDRYSLSDELPNEDSRLREEFPLWLAKVQSEKLVLAIDALNQLPVVDNELGWLPEYIPPNVRLVVSATEGISYDNLHKRAWQEAEVRPLTSAMRHSIAVGFLSKYHKSLTDAEFAMIAGEPKCESPLFLRTVLEELRVFGVYEEYETHLAACLASPDERELFQHVLSRLEGIYGIETVRSVMRAIWAARYGASENELLEITRRTRLDLSLLIAGLEYHLMQPAGLYTFFHQYLRDAVRERYIPNEEDERKAHAHIARYFADTPLSSRRVSEEPWQWREARDWERFRKTLTDIPMLELLLPDEKRMELMSYWTTLKEHFDLDAVYRKAITDFKEHADESHFADLSAKLGDALTAASSYKEAEYHISQALELRKKLFGEEDLEMAQTMNDLATVYYHTGDFTKAETLQRRSIEIFEQKLDKKDPLTAKAVNDLATMFYAQGKLDKAEEGFLDVLSRYQVHYKNEHSEIASTLTNLGAIAYFKKEYDKAIEYYNRSIEMYSHIYGEKHYSLIPVMTNLALTYIQIFEFQAAESLFLKTITLNKAIYGYSHTLLANTYLNLGVLYSRMRNYPKAIEMHSQALEINKKNLGEEHYATINSYLSLGLNKYRNGEKEEGRKMVNYYLPLQLKTLGAHHQMYKVQEDAWSEVQGK